MKLLTHLKSRIFETPLAIDAEKLEVILSAIGPRLEANWEKRTALDLAAALEAQDDFEPAQRKSYKVTDDGIAVIPVQGTLMKKASGLWALSGLSTYERIGRQVSDAVNDPQVRGILLDVDSPGGETHGMFELSDQIYAARKQKPIYAVTNDSALSAAYAIASAAEKIFVTRTGACGSIGVFSLHEDRSGADEQAGLRYTYIKAGAKKAQGNPHEPLAKSAKNDAQAEVDRQYQMFCETVARNRKTDPQTISDTEAGVYFAQNAIPLLADSLGTFEEALAAIVTRVNGASPQASASIPNSGETMPAIPPHKTATVKKAWDGPANKARLKEGEDQAYYEKAHAYRDADEDPDTKGAYTYIHHEVSESGDIGAANIKACTSGIGLLNGGRGGKGRNSYSQEEREGIYKHLAKHIRDAGEEPPELKSLAAIAAESEGTDSMAKNDELAIAAKKGEDADYEMKKGKKDTKGKKPSDDDDNDDDDNDDDDNDDNDDDDNDDNGDKKDAKKPSEKSGKKASGKKASGKKAGEECKDDKDDKKAASESGDYRAECQRIAGLCELAGKPNLAAKFISKGLTVAQVEAKLLDLRSEESNQNPVDSNFGTMAPDALTKIAQTAAQLPVVPGQTKSEAFAKLLAQNPQIYEQLNDERAEVEHSQLAKRAYVKRIAPQFAAIGLGTGAF